MLAGASQDTSFMKSICPWKLALMVVSPVLFRRRSLTATKRSRAEGMESLVMMVHRSSRVILLGRPWMCVCVDICMFAYGVCCLHTWLFTCVVCVHIYCEGGYVCALLSMRTQTQTHKVSLGTRLGRPGNEAIACQTNNKLLYAITRDYWGWLLELIGDYWRLL